jgi:hypothetical protein
MKRSAACAARCIHTCIYAAAGHVVLSKPCCEVLACSLQRQGNDALKQGLAIRKKFYLRKAVDHYTAGIAVGISDAALNSVLHANRAQAELKLGNSRNAMRDALRAVQLDPDNMKVGVAAVSVHFVA